MNALLKDILSGEIADPYGGTEDIKNRIIRHIDDKKFGEDPLRALRAAQFRSRFGFQVAPPRFQSVVRWTSGIFRPSASRWR